MTRRRPEPRAAVPLVQVVRSGLIEGVHRGHVVVLGPDGSVQTARGQVDATMFPRSCNKPLQAIGLLRAGFTGTERQLALASASHSGEPVHVSVVRSILAGARAGTRADADSDGGAGEGGGGRGGAGRGGAGRGGAGEAGPGGVGTDEGGLDESGLRCPPDLPLDEAARRAILACGGGPRPILMNCSGKHAAMLSTCVSRGWTCPDYLDPAHPLQLELARALAELAGQGIDAVGVDGCGAPVFALSLTGLARAFLRLADAEQGPAHAVAAAMRAHPELVGGTGRTVTRLMAGLPGLVAKDGAEGVWAAALPGVGAVAVKIDDGAMRAADRVVVAVLRELTALRGPAAQRGPVASAGPPGSASVLDELAVEPLLGGGRPVGEVRMIPGAL